MVVKAGSSGNAAAGADLTPQALTLGRGAGVRLSLSLFMLEISLAESVSVSCEVGTSMETSASDEMGAGVEEVAFARSTSDSDTGEVALEMDADDSPSLIEVEGVVAPEGVEVTSLDSFAADLAAEAYETVPDIVDQT